VGSVNSSPPEWTVADAAVGSAINRMTEANAIGPVSLRIGVSQLLLMLVAS
jgi:hypothetical protein